jgi:hypothetical protein
MPGEAASARPRGSARWRVIWVGYHASDARVWSRAIGVALAPSTAWEQTRPRLISRTTRAAACPEIVRNSDLSGRSEPGSGSDYGYRKAATIKIALFHVL